jgi:CheY-like chemotaxis protein
VILCDIGLPGISGYEVAERVSCDNELKDTFLIALSGYAQQYDIERSKIAGFRRHLAKPVQLDLLKKVLAEADN